MDVFYRVEKHDVNPVPAILAETFLSLQVCHQKQHGKLRCCAPMLYVWIMTHMYARNNIEGIDDPFKGFLRIPLKSRKLQEWMQEFDQIDSRSFSWMCPWYKGDSVIFSCGSFPNVPLMGPRGCISYSPTLVIRQLKWTQDELPEELLGGISFLYQECEAIKSQTTAVRSAWNDIQEKGLNELGRRIIAHTRGYDEWREARRRYPTRPEPSTNKETNPLTKDQALGKIEILRAQMEVLDKKNEASEITIVTLQSKIQKLNLQIERLKDECADAYKAPSCVKRAKKEKESKFRDLMAKEEHQERMLMKVRKEKEESEANVRIHVRTIQILEERIRSIHEALAQTEHYSEQGWNMVAKYRESLLEANKREELLRLKVRELEEGEARRHAELVEGWKSGIRDLVDEREKWRKKYEDMADSLQYHTSQLAEQFEEASIQIQMNPWLQLPPKVVEFWTHCQKFAKGFRKKKMKLLM